MEVKILNNSMTISISINGSCTVTSVRHRMNALKSDIDSTIKQLKRINNGLSNINGPVNGNISSAINGINRRIRSEEEKREAIVEIDEKIDAFVEHALATDRSVARNIHQNEKRFYKQYPWLKPDIIPKKNVWQNMLEGGKALLKKIGNGLKEIWKGVKEFVKEHALEIIIGTIGIIVAVVLTVLTGGTIWAAILVVFKSVVISMAVSAALSTGIALITGGDIKKAFLDGLASGYMWGGIFASVASVGRLMPKKYPKEVLDNLSSPNADNAAVEHIFEGQINPRRQAVGYHYNMIKGTKGRIVLGTKRLFPKGSYTAKVKVSGILKSGNNGFSSFFPDSMSPSEVWSAINEAFLNKAHLHGNVWQGQSKSGMDIILYLKNGKFFDAFPHI